MRMRRNQLTFRRVVFYEGSEHIPNDLPLDLSYIREWAMKSGYVSEAVSQLVLEERIDDIARVARPEDDLGIALAISMENKGREYLEYPSLPVRSLIKRGTEVPIVYWRTNPTQWDEDGNATVFGEVKFGFRLEGCGDEFCCVSNAVRVAEKFVSKLDELVPSAAVHVMPNGSREVTVEGSVLAKFFQQGRSFDVTLEEAFH